MTAVTLEPEQVLAWLRDMPATKAIPRLLALNGGSMTEGAILDALELRGKTLDNTLPQLVKDGTVWRNGRTVSIQRPDTAPSLSGQSPEPVWSKPDGSPEQCPHTAPTSPDDRPDSAPTSGSTVSNDKGAKISKNVSPIILSSLSSLSSLEKETTKTEPKEPKNTKSLSALSSWSALLENPSFHLPQWLDQPLWAQWLEDLAVRKLKITPGALREQLDKLKACQDAGIPQATAIKTAISRGWKTVGEPDWFTPKAAAPTRPAVRAKSGSTEENLAKLQAAFGLPPTVEVL